MNDAIFKFKRYEDSSLSYTGINKHEGEDVGGWDTVIKREEYEQLFYNQQAAMEAPVIDESDIPDAPYVAPVDEEEEEIVAPPPPKITHIPIAQKATTPYGKPNYITSAYGIKSPVAPPSKKKEEIVAMDMSKVKIGTSVTHKSFGEGKIVQIKGNYITISFGKAQKVFMLPDAFVNGYLKF